MDGTHADVDVIATEGLSIKVEQARDLAALSAHRPSVGPWRVIIIEDADRLTERAADALLKAIEEPVARTVWILCAPSLEDVVITIRSRSRHVRLRTPPAAAVAELLERRDGIDGAMAMYAARAAQSHVGLARRLARDEGARIRRRDVPALAGKIREWGTPSMRRLTWPRLRTTSPARRPLSATPPSGSASWRSSGPTPSARTQPPHIRSQLASLEKEQKARATRHSRDVLDRSLLDLLSMYRDALVLHTGAAVGLVNEDSMAAVQQLAHAMSPEQPLQAIDAIGTARERIGLNVNPLLALEAMASLRLPA